MPTQHSCPHLNHKYQWRSSGLATPRQWAGVCPGYHTRTAMHQRRSVLSLWPLRCPWRSVGAGPYRFSWDINGILMGKYVGIKGDINIISYNRHVQLYSAIIQQHLFFRKVWPCDFIFDNNATVNARVWNGLVPCSSCSFVWSPKHVNSFIAKPGMIQTFKPWSSKIKGFFCLKNHWMVTVPVTAVQVDPPCRGSGAAWSYRRCRFSGGWHFPIIFVYNLQRMNMGYADYHHGFPALIHTNWCDFRAFLIFCARCTLM